MNARIAKAAQALKGEGAYEVLAKAKALEATGKNIVHLEIGQPDFVTPAYIIDEATASLRRGDTGYAPAAGLHELREAIALREGKLRNRTIGAGSVFVTPGAKTSLFLAMAATVNPGDEVIVPDPGFPAYESIALYLGAVPKGLPIVEDKQFSFDRDAFQSLVSDKTALVVLNSPSNPTGGIIPKEDLAFVAELAQKHNFYILSDEIYDELAFEGDAPSIAECEGMQDRTFIVNGFSKTYAMPGWRLGYVVVPKGFEETAEMLAVNVFSCTNTFVQRAGVRALEQTDETEAMKEEYRRRRDFVVTTLNAIPGVTCTSPGGAFYAFPNVSSFGHTSEEIANHLLENVGVAVLAGTYFGGQGEGYLRLSFATSMKELEEGLKRIQAGLGTL